MNSNQIEWAEYEPENEQEIVTKLSKQQEGRTPRFEESTYNRKQNFFGASFNRFPSFYSAN